MLPEVRLTSRIRAVADDLAWRTSLSYGNRVFFHSEAYFALPKSVQYLGSGLYRDAYRYGDLVMKVGTAFTARSGGNLSEKFFFDQLREDGWGWFVPHVAVIPAGRFVVSVMHFVDFDEKAAHADWPDNWGLFRELGEMLAYDYDYRDAHGMNLVVQSSTGMPVLIDGGHSSMSNRRSLASVA